MPPEKKTGRRRISPREQSRRAGQREQSFLGAVERLLYSRAQTAHALGGISIATVLRIENKGLLDKVRLAGSHGAVFHRVEQVQALARRGDTASAS